MNNDNKLTNSSNEGQPYGSMDNSSQVSKASLPIDTKIKNETHESTIQEDTFSSVGFGVWTFNYFLLCSLHIAFLSSALVSSELTAPIVNFTCVDEKLNSSDLIMDRSQCFAINSSQSSSIKVPCHEFHYDTSVFTSTLTAEFNLVCDRKSLQTIYQVMFSFGALVGGLFAGIIADKYGRQPVVYGNILLSFFIMIIVVFIPSFSVLIFFRFLLGITVNCVYITCYTLGIESSPIKYREYFVITLVSPFALQTSILGLIGYLHRDWRTIHLLSCIPLFLMIIIANPWFLSESPRWLAQRGRISKSVKVLRKAARLNRTSHQLSENIHDNLEQHYLKNKDLSSELTVREKMMCLISSKPMVILLIVSALESFFTGFIYISVPMESKFTTSQFLFLGMIGLAELPSGFIVLLTKKIGKRNYVVGGFALIAVLETVHGILASLGIVSDTTEIAQSCLVYFMITTVCATSHTCCIELYPTSVRSIGSAVVFFMLSVGHGLQPVFHLILPEDLKWVAYFVYAAMALVGCLIILSLPDMHKKPLMQSVEEYKLYMKQNRKK